MTNPQNEKSIPLQQPIDNRDSSLSVGIRSVVYWVGYHNVTSADFVSWRRTSSDKPTPVPITPGLYNCKQLSKILADAVRGIQMEMSDVNGMATVTIPDGVEIMLSSGLRSLLGLDDDGWLSAGKYIGDRTVDFLPHKALCFHLNQVSSTANVVDGHPSQLLDLVPLGDDGFGSCISHFFSNPAFKRLEDGVIGELSLRIENLDGLGIQNSLPVVVTLEIK